MHTSTQNMIREIGPPEGEEIEGGGKARHEADGFAYTCTTYTRSAFQM